MLRPRWRTIRIASVTGAVASIVSMMALTVGMAWYIHPTLGATLLFVYTGGASLGGYIMAIEHGDEHV